MIRVINWLLKSIWCSRRRQQVRWSLYIIRESTIRIPHSDLHGDIASNQPILFSSLSVSDILYIAGKYIPKPVPLERRKSDPRHDTLALPNAAGRGSSMDSMTWRWRCPTGINTSAPFPFITDIRITLSAEMVRTFALHLLEQYSALPNVLMLQARSFDRKYHGQNPAIKPILKLIGAVLLKGPEGDGHQLLYLEQALDTISPPTW